MGVAWWWVFVFGVNSPCPITYPPMSEEQLKAFLEAVKADAALQKKLQAATDADAAVAIAKEAGFVISAETFNNDQLSDEDLEGVAGGGCGYLCWPNFSIKGSDGGASE